MTSQINPNNIDGTFPVAGQDNSSQGFRDNFTNTKNNFQYAYDEISALQANATIKGQTNDFGNGILSNAALSGATEVLYDLGVASGAKTYSFTNSSYQSLELGGSVVLTIADIPTLSDRAVTIKLRVHVPNISWTMTWPSSVSINLSSIANTSGQVTSFTSIGIYEFVLTTIDSGTTWAISETTRTRSIVQGGFRVQTTLANTSVDAISMTVSNVAGTIYGNISASYFIGNIISLGPNNVSLTGNLTANNITANTGIYGTLQTATQPQVTLLGTQTSLSVSGNANVGNLTTTGMTDMCGGDMVGVQLAPATNTGSTQLWSNIGFVLINPNASTIASHTITMPATPANGQMIRFAFANTITTLTQNGYGTDAVYGGITTANTAAGTTWIYYKLADINSGNGVWYRVG